MVTKEVGRPYYDIARDLVEELAVAGKSQWAMRIEDAVVSGTTSSEILMLLRVELAELFQSGDLPSFVLEHAVELRNEVWRLLG